MAMCFRVCGAAWLICNASCLVFFPSRNLCKCEKITMSHKENPNKERSKNEQPQQDAVMENKPFNFWVSFLPCVWSSATFLSCLSSSFLFPLVYIDTLFRRKVHVFFRRCWTLIHFISWLLSRAIFVHRCYYYFGGGDDDEEVVLFFCFHYFSSYEKSQTRWLPNWGKCVLTHRMHEKNKIKSTIPKKQTMCERHTIHVC